MSQQVVLHVGAMKSGTTYLQGFLFENKKALAERGVLVPGPRKGDQALAVADVLGHAAGRAHTGQWQALVDEVRAHEGTVVISHEFLGPAMPEKVDRVLGYFDDVTVVVTARDLNRNLPAMWQESVQNGRSWTYGEFVRAARDARPRPDRAEEDVTPAGKSFWRQQNLVRICRNWSRGPGRLVLITVPPPGASQHVLRDRFLSVVGTDSDGLVDPPRSNPAIGVASAEALRRANALLDQQGLAFPAGQQVRKNLLADLQAIAHRSGEPKIGLPLEQWVVDYADRMRARLQSRDLDLVGDWADLTPRSVPGEDPDGVDTASVGEAAVAWLSGAIAREIRR